jgi:hypothetical protein
MDPLNLAHFHHFGYYYTILNTIKVSEQQLQNLNNVLPIPTMLTRIFLIYSMKFVNEKWKLRTRAKLIHNWVKAW